MGKNNKSWTPGFKVDYKRGAPDRVVVSCGVLWPHERDKRVLSGFFCEAPVSCARSPHSDKRSSQTYRLEEEQRPDVVPLRVDHFIQHAEPEALLPVRVFGVGDTVLQMPVVLFHDGDRTPRHASLSVWRFSSASIHAGAASSVHRAGASSPENSDDAHADVRGCATLETKFSPPPPPFKKYQTRETVGAATQRSGGGTQREGGREERDDPSLPVRT